MKTIYFLLSILIAGLTMNRKAIAEEGLALGSSENLYYESNVNGADSVAAEDFRVQSVEKVFPPEFFVNETSGEARVDAEAAEEKAFQAVVHIDREQNDIAPVRDADIRVSRPLSREQGLFVYQSQDANGSWRINTYTTASEFDDSQGLGVMVTVGETELRVIESEIRVYDANSLLAVVEWRNYRSVNGALVFSRVEAGQRDANNELIAVSWTTQAHFPMGSNNWITSTGTEYPGTDQFELLLFNRSN